ncbi:RimK family alpha-L-glutamate ligase [soil metagenome]
MNKILVIVGGKKRKLNDFKEAAKNLDVDVKLASLSELNYASSSPYKLKIGASDVADFKLIYIRVVGSHLEDATLLANYAKEKGIKVVDSLYEEAHLMPSSLGKSIETAKLIKAGISMPKTFFGSLTNIVSKAKEEFGFPFVVKSTTGKKAREVWSPNSEEELIELLINLKKLEKNNHMRFFAQEFIAGSQRTRVFVIGENAVAAVTRPTKWRRRFIDKVNGEVPVGEKKAIVPVPAKDAEVALSAAKVLGLDIAGVDILHKDNSDELFVLEANAAPSWKLIKKDTDIKVEEEILKFLLTKI